jgi:hypothetical protein
MKISLRTVLIALVVLVAAGGVISTVPSDTKMITGKNFSTGQCQEQNGVSLVVDFGKSSGLEPLQLCAKDFKSTGWDIFAAAGLSVEGTSEYPTGFVCRLGGWPSEEIQPCTKTPTVSQGTWSYFVADATDTDWKFSGQGAATRKPSCGAAEGWRFIEAGESASQKTPRAKPATFVCK